VPPAPPQSPGGPAAEPPSRLDSVVVVGGGLAGARAVQELRAQGHRGRLTLVGAEPHRPYDRPPLSKDLLSGRVDDSALDVDWAALDVDFRLGCRATGLREGALETDRGDVGWDGLVVATGAQPRLLPGTEASEHVQALRTVDDARRLRAELRRGARVVVVGAGWIGAEVATAAAAAGCAVTVVEAAPAPLAGALGPDVGARTARWYEAAGVDLRLGTAVEEVAPGRVFLAGGAELPADAVVVGIGARPSTAWLAGTGLLDDDGCVGVDERLAARWPRVVAAGDCCAWQSRRFGARLHVEHWDDALQAPAVAVTTLLGGDAVHDPVPYFWSDQLGHVVQFAGYHRDADRVVERGDPAGTEGWALCWLREGRLVAVLAVDRPRDLVQGRRAIADGRAPDPGRLADPAVPLKSAWPAGP
jgi:3-phenylpropionate/trans-cinnamate dioxygenase ferredoxin reductase component